MQWKTPFCIDNLTEIEKKSFSLFKLNMEVINVLILILVSNFSKIFGYNLDMKDPFMLKYGNSSYFGYSIILTKSAMIIGAPKDNYSRGGVSYKLPREPGAAWHYILDSGEWTQWVPKITDDVGHIDRFDVITLAMKTKGWFGASMALKGDDDTLTICAPRTMVSFTSRIDPRTYDLSMHGMCYNGRISSGLFQIEDPSLSTYDFGGAWRNPIRGFSVHYPSLWSNQTKNNEEMIMGNPKNNYCGSVTIETQIKSVELSEIDPLTQFGYAVSSGRFFDKKRLLYVGGGPGWNYVGQVGIIDPNLDQFDQPSIINKLNGTTTGEYFGASLAVGDMNKDGLDDLIIGAPHCGNDVGRVYIYLGNTKGFSKADVVLDGYSDDGLFGYSLTCGDLDADGFDDLIVGAPFEDGGKIYIYNGGSNISQETVKSSQKVHVHSRVRSFAFSLSKPVDIDANGFPDIGVGAYKSGHAVLLKTRPVVKTNLQVSIVPSSLDQNSTDFLVEICVEHTERKLPAMKSFDLILNVDEQFKRVIKSQIVLSYIHRWNISSMVTKVCLNTTIYILGSVDKNFYDPIDIVITHTFGLMQRLPNMKIGECELCPIEEKGASSKASHLVVPFDLGCGPDKFCLAVIELHANFDGNKPAWIIGSEDITYEVYIRNHGEPAYSTEIIVEIPQGISLRTYLSSCKKHVDAAGLLKMTCSGDNPLYVNNTNKIDFVFDMSQLDDGSVNGTYLNFNVSVKTRSENSGAQNISTSLLLLSHIVTVVEGSAIDRNYHYTLNDETSNINFQHTYEVLKSGATPIKRAILNVDVPTKFEDLDLIVLNAEPNIRISGKMYKCSVIDIPIHGKRDDIATMTLKSLDDGQLRRARDTSELPQKVPSRHESAFNDTIDDHVINLDCLSSNVSCSKISCEIPFLKSREDTVSLQLYFSINLKLLAERKKSDNKKYDILFTTQGWIEIVQPFIESKKITKVHTAFRQDEKLKRMNIWIIIGSVLLGLLVLFVIAVILWMLGFFRRAKKDEMDALKSKKDEDNSMQLKDPKL